MKRLVPFCAAVLLAAAPAAAVTLGPGPVLGTDLAGWTYHEEFKDWTWSDVRALDASDDVYAFNDGHDDGRDLLAFYQRYEGDDVYLRVDFLDLSAGWQDNLNLYIAIDCAPGGAEWLPDFLDVRTGNPWEVCLALYADGDVAGTTFNVYDSGYGTAWNYMFMGSYWHRELDAVEMRVPRGMLLTAGWDGSSVVHFQVVTAKDFAETTCSAGDASSDLADAIVDDDRGCADGELNGAVRSDDQGGRVQYASIAHGNQSLNRGGDLRVHVHDPEWNTGIPGGTGFVRALDTHRIFGVPLNIHVSGTLITGLAWAAAPTGAADPSDGPGLLDEIALFADSDQNDRPGALIGGVFAEHIMPYFEGPVNAASFAVADSLHEALFGLTTGDLKVMHVPERVIRSYPTGLSPADGFTFADIVASGYDATYLDAAAHLHHWFYPGESEWPDPTYRHKAHHINGVLCWMINHREDNYKFWVQDEGLHLDTRRSLIDKAVGYEPQLVLVFDDWEALAGKSFDPIAGQSTPNDNPIQYQTTIRWIANHPWIEMVTLAEMTDRALADPGAWIVEQGTRTDLDVMTYHWLQHACEDSYHNWYYNSAGGVPGNEQSLYDLVPVISGEQGDYHVRGVGPEADGPGLPSGTPHGDLNSPGTLMHDAWAAVAAAPTGDLRFLAETAYSAMIYETAWHEEDNTNYEDSDGFGNWLYPDLSWDGHSKWALRLQNHTRDAVGLALAAAWADSVRDGLLSPHAAPAAWAADADLDGFDEFILRNGRVWLLWQHQGGRCLLAARFDGDRDDAVLLLGNPVANPSAPGEEEYANAAASRCTGFKVMNGGYADDPFTPTLLAGGLGFVSADGQVQLTHTLAAGSDTLSTQVAETVGGALYLRLGLNPDLKRLLLHGPGQLVREHDGPAPETSTWYRLRAGEASVTLLYDDTSFTPAPLYAGWDRRDLPLTEEAELSGDGSFAFRTVLGAGGDLTAAPDAPPPAAAALARLLPPAPNPFNPATEIRFVLDRPAEVELDIYASDGRHVRTLYSGAAPAGESAFTWRGDDDSGRTVPTGLYLVRLRYTGSQSAVKVLLLK
ncbi:hypothetical protein H8E07_08410 [bacterium]|nr:hypothetical protein [bacterium]